MTIKTPSDLKRFHEFVTDQLDNGGAELSPEDALQMFRAKQSNEHFTSADQTTSWTDEKNQRRYDLVDKEIAGAIPPEECAELDKLQGEMLAYRRQVAPLPLDDLRKLHDDLLKKAGGKSA